MAEKPTPTDSTRPSRLRDWPGRGRLGFKLLATAAVLVAIGAVGSMGTLSSLNDITTNPGNTFTSGTVKISDNDAGGTSVALDNAAPGATIAGCLVVTYTGTLPANVRLYGTNTGTGLDQYLDFTLTRGTISGTPTPGSCTGFTADSTDYKGLGAGVIYSGTLDAYPASSAAAIVDPISTSAATWNTGTVHSYKLQMTLQSAAAGQGLNTTESFSWEAQNK